MLSLSKLAQANGTAMERTGNELLWLTSCLLSKIKNPIGGDKWFLGLNRYTRWQKKRALVSHKAENNYTSGYRLSLLSSTLFWWNTGELYLAQILSLRNCSYFSWTPNFLLLFTRSPANSNISLSEDFCIPLLRCHPMVEVFECSVHFLKQGIPKFHNLLTIHVHVCESELTFI